MSKKITIIVGHGSRVEKSNNEFERFVKNFGSRLPEREFRVGYLELAKPDFKTALENALLSADEVTVLPLFLLTAGHIKHDITNIVNDARYRFADKKIILAPALGVHPHMVNLVNKRVAETILSVDKDPEEVALLMIGRGSSDIEAKSDFCKLVRLVAEQESYQKVDYCFIAVARPSVEEALERLIQEGHRKILLSPYLIFNGLLWERLERFVEQHNSMPPGLTVKLAKTLGEDDFIFELLEKRLWEGKLKKEQLLYSSCGYIAEPQRQS